MKCFIVNFYIYYNIYIYIYIYKIVVNPKRYTGIDWYPKYIVPLAKLVQPSVWYWLPWLNYLQNWAGVKEEKSKLLKCFFFQLYTMYNQSS